MKTKIVVSFVAGFFTGSIATYILIKKPWQNRTKKKTYLTEEFDDDKEAPVVWNHEYGEDSERIAKKTAETFENFNKVITEDYGGHCYVDEKKPYVPVELITEDEFGEDPSYYKPVTLYYYVNKVLADENDAVIEDIEGAIGHDYLVLFDNPDINSVYIRNYHRRIDYEILRSLKDYKPPVTGHVYIWQDAEE